ncbi:Vacuolar protein sorting-associated protein 55 [Entomophthora muscae]|uniref:Vacuolar protein sorting-associated protein 55 n=1 Tax=Entomophthora muscae TaxID=34485 RepID=A0ACC2T354_9FUNG|nr:Vacuolar protein sorting-associated protein 55 [Entomophthora muscae]
MIYRNWYPLIIVATYLVASIPNPVCGRCTATDDLLSDSSNSGFADAGRFLTSVFMVSGFGLPVVFSHAKLIETSAAILSTFGGVLIYSSVLLYGYFFAVEEEF